MELRYLFSFVRKWFWLLLIGAVIGGAIAYYPSARQEPVYRSTTKVMVIQPTESVASDLTRLTDLELAETFRNLLVTRPVLEATSERVGGRVSAGQISSRLIEGTLLLEVTVTDREPEQAAIIANALVDSLIEQNEVIQSGRFAASEESLQAQINQVEDQISELRATEGQGLSAEEQAERQLRLESRVIELNSQKVELEEEIADLTAEFENPSMSPEMSDLLNQKQIALTVANLELEEALADYRNLIVFNGTEIQLQDQLALVTEISTSINQLETEIADILLVDDSSESIVAQRELLNNKRAELSLLRLELDIVNDQYKQLINTGESQSANNPDSFGSGSNLALYQQIYTSLLTNYEAVRLARTQNTPNIVQVEAALPGGPEKPNPMSSAMFGATIGLILAGGIAFVVEYLDDTLKSQEDINTVMGLPVIGFINETPEMTRDSASPDKEHTGPYIIRNPRSPVAEAFRGLRTNLGFSNSDSPIKTILVTSPGPQEGKTTIAANLAAIYSQEPRRTVVVDGDLRRPQLHNIFGLKNHNGLTSNFVNAIDLEKSDGHGLVLFNDNLVVLPSGKVPPNPTELLASNRMTEIINHYRNYSGIVIIDSPPSVVSDAAVLSAKVDGVIIVIRPGHTHSGAALSLLEQLRRADARVLGVVLNRIPKKRYGYYGQYRYRYSPYYYGEYSYYDTYDDQQADGQGHKRRSRRSSLLTRVLGSRKSKVRQSSGEGEQRASNGKL